jgi:hypothetical protein
MGGRIEGHVMVHRTDIAGSCKGRASPRRDGICLAQSAPFSKAAPYSSDRKRCRLTAAVPWVHVIYLELQTL